MSRNLIAVVFLLVPSSIVMLASDPSGLPKTCETSKIAALRSAAFRGPTAPGIADDQFRLAVAIEQAARRCPTGKEDGLNEAHDWYGTAGAKNHAEAAYRAALYELDRPEAGFGLAFLNIAASNGHAAAQAKLAMCHLKGVGVIEIYRTGTSFSFVPHLWHWGLVATPLQLLHRDGVRDRGLRHVNLQASADPIPSIQASRRSAERARAAASNTLPAVTSTDCRMPAGQ